MIAGTAIVAELDPYISAIVEMAEEVLRAPLPASRRNQLPEILDGQAATKLRDIVPLPERRKTGAFFSSSDLREFALEPWQHDVGFDGPVLDPAMGAGDLLLEFARRLPAKKDLIDTLRQWGTILHGRDIEPSFVRLAKARLVLLAASRSARRTGIGSLGLDDALPEIRVGDGLTLLEQGWPGGHILMNPPYIYAKAPDRIDWARGQTNLSALFLSSAVEFAAHGTRVTAILPDVIRTGSRYARLRSALESRLDIHSIQTYGRFDPWTDIDVFLLRGRVANQASNANKIEWWAAAAGRELSDLFHISVGPVVPHRHAESGTHRPYLDSRTLPIGGNYDVSHAQRRAFNSRVVVPPFVVVRRTSRPGDRTRGAGTLVTGEEGILVENHLIILRPKDGTIETCRQLAKSLESDGTRQWLDERIRCRHLTVRALREAPWEQA